MFTKIDAFFPNLEEGNPLLATAPAVPSYDEADGLAVHEQMRTLLKEWDAWEIETHMSQYYDDYRYFGVSALGAQPDYDEGARGRRRGAAAPGRGPDPVADVQGQDGEGGEAEVTDTAFGRLLYTDCAPGTGRGSGGGFQIQAQSPAVDPQQASFAVGWLLYEAQSAWVADRRPVEDFPLGFAHAEAEGSAPRRAGTSGRRRSAAGWATTWPTAC